MTVSCDNTGKLMGSTETFCFRPHGWGSWTDSFLGQSWRPATSCRSKAFVSWITARSVRSSCYAAWTAGIHLPRNALNNAEQSCWASACAVHMCALVSQWGSSGFFSVTPLDPSQRPGGRLSPPLPSALEAHFTLLTDENVTSRARGT